MNAASAEHRHSSFTPWDNPMGTDGFEFIEYAAPDPEAMGAAVRAHGLHGRSPGTATRT